MAKYTALISSTTVKVENAFLQKRYGELHEFGLLFDYGRLSTD